MNLTDQLLAALSVYGLPLLFGVIAIAAVGVPMPVTLMLVAAGSFVELGEMKLWQVLVVASGAAVEAVSSCIVTRVARSAVGPSASRL